MSTSGLLALAVGVALQMLTAIMDSDVSAASGPKGCHDTSRAASRPRP
jgi:hypothetical protein